MSTSKFQDIRASLKTLVDSRLTTDGVTGVDVFAYPPVGDVAREDMVWFGRIASDQGPLTMGGTGRGVAETLDVDFHIRAPYHGSDVATQGAADGRAETILASVENALRADSTVGGAVMFAEVTAFESIPDNDADGPIGTVEGTISVEVNL